MDELSDDPPPNPHTTPLQTTPSSNMLISFSSHHIHDHVGQLGGGSVFGLSLFFFSGQHPLLLLLFLLGPSPLILTIILILKLILVDLIHFPMSQSPPHPRKRLWDGGNIKIELLISYFISHTQYICYHNISERRKRRI